MNAIYRSEAGEREVRRRYLEALDAWPVPAERVRLPTREGETFVLVCGPRDAPPVVLLHGSGANSAVWAGDAPTWSRHLRMYAVDLVGEPGLSAPARPALGSDAVALWLDDVMDGLGLSRAAFVGMSLGGWAALDHAVRRPGRVERLALVCPGGIGRQTPLRLAPALAWTPFGRWGRLRSVRAVLGLHDPRYAPLVEEVAAAFGEFRPRTETLPVFSDADLCSLDMPVMAVVGDRDLMLDSADTARRLRAHVPHAEVTVLPGVGHAVIGQGPAVLDFLRA
ncbi:alpha/beta fold hydrolase [Nocardiopsis changdeensis]|uniref:Alpha/beta fold hydrolase n=1 Tax=Nocardiopsis changdeensis TaxID=2831969 RepID=A0ABX8BTY2_9ACTN|nr:MULTISPECIES: alpha/beta fold hydrolase [Nocardiopsis]QUX25561.1 alpha/beta fold hydrolase [Nocardiopsis changdeensis]QYX35947.1 alpha/beta fold hydrolase [Nocardiopsis sp. MT53]